MAELRAQRLKLESEMGFYQRDRARHTCAERLLKTRMPWLSSSAKCQVRGKKKQRVNQRFDVELLQLRKRCGPSVTARCPRLAARPSCEGTAGLHPGAGACSAAHAVVHLEHQPRFAQDVDLPLPAA